MEVGVDPVRCEANGVCAALAPEVFELDDEEVLLVRQAPVPEIEVERVSQAVEACPMNALYIKD